MFGLGGLMCFCRGGKSWGVEGEDPRLLHSKVYTFSQPPLQNPKTKLET